jgi:hypothetical protein
MTVLSAGSVQGAFVKGIFLLEPGKTDNPLPEHFKQTRCALHNFSSSSELVTASSGSTLTGRGVDLMQLRKHCLQTESAHLWQQMTSF